MAREYDEHGWPTDGFDREPPDDNDGFGNDEDPYTKDEWEDIYADR
ncbi:hypothetical protein ACVA51_10705 [Pseudomonas luteola]